MEGLRLFIAGRYDRRSPHIRLSVGTEPGRWRGGLYLASARHALHPHVAYVQDQRTICLQSDVPLPIQADGEFLGERTELVIESVPDALTVVS